MTMLLEMPPTLRARRDILRQRTFISSKVKAKRNDDTHAFIWHIEDHGHHRLSKSAFAALRLL